MKKSFITMKRKLACNLMVFALALTAVTVPGRAQQSGTNQPPATTPQVPSFRTQPGQLLDRLLTKPPEVAPPVQGTVTAAETGTETLIASTLRGVLIVKTRDEIQATGAPQVRGVEVRDIPVLSGIDFEEVIAPYLGRPLAVSGVKNLQRDIILYCRAKNRPLVDVILPEQTVENGVIQLWFLEGKVGAVTVQATGNKWFRDKQILDQVRLRAGDPVDSRKLMDDLDRINRNPFHQVDVQFKQGAQVGRSDVVLLSQERFPVRLYAGYDDSGTKLTGNDRVTGGLNWGNAFGLDHELNYQYTTDTSFDLVKAHSGSYVVPLPWRHTLTLFGSYVDAKADLPIKGFSQHGFSYQLSLRYGVPLPSWDTYRHEVSLGYDYKASNNNLLFGGTNAPPSVPEVDQFELGYRGLLSDRFGQTSFGLEIYYSPGGLSGNNNDSEFRKLRSATVANYEYARLNVERDTRLRGDFSWIFKITGQFASDRLLPSEELGAGGYSTVRGYDERIANGDEGWIINNELRTPPISLLRFSPVHLGGPPKSGESVAAARAYPDQFQLLGFFDYGTTHITKAQGDEPNFYLASVGAGVRYVINRYLSVRLDYGWQLTPLNKDAIQKTNASSDDSRGHIGVVLSY